MTTIPSNWQGTKDCLQLTPAAVTPASDSMFTSEEWAAFTPSERTVIRCTTVLPQFGPLAAKACEYLLAVEADKAEYGDDAGPATYPFIRWFMALDEADRAEVEACVEIAYGLV